MKLSLILGLMLAIASSAFADNKFSFTYKNEDVTKVIEDYSKNAAQKFVYDANVRGRVTILNPDKIDTTEAFNQLSEALALQGYGVSQRDGTYVVQTARNIQRSLIEVSTTLPALKPERMVTWIYQPQNLNAEALNRDLRILSSKDGEMSIFLSKNQVVITDWTSNLHRIQKTLAEMDKPVTNAAVAKMIEQNEKERKERRAKGPVPPPEMKEMEAKAPKNMEMTTEIKKVK